MPEDGQQTSERSIRISQARASTASARVEALLTRLDSAEEVTERARLFVDVAVGLRDDLGDPAQAVDALLEAWSLDPAFDPILDHLEPLVRAQGRWPEVLEATRTLVTQTTDARRSLIYCETMVRWLTRELLDPDLARQWVERVRVLDSTHALVHLFQAALSREHGDVKRELDELDLAVLSTRRADDRARIHLMMASRYREDRTLNLAEAKKHYAAAHKLFPTTMEPLRGLEQIAEIEGDKVALSDVLRRQAEAEVTPDERVDILMRLAKLEELEFRKPELAARTLERVVAADENNEAALDALERCLAGARMWNELAGLLERAAAADIAPALRMGRLTRLGEVFEGKLGDVRAALAAYQRLAGILPEDETVVGELARLAEKVSDSQLAVNCRERLAELATDPHVRARHHVIAGQLLLPIDGKLARRHFESAVESDPSSGAAWNALLWDARAENDGLRLERYLLDRAMRTELPRARASAFVELADLRARNGDEVSARDAWEAAIKADPTNEAAAAAMIEPLIAEERWEEVDPLTDVVVAGAERDRDYERLFAARRAQTEIAVARGLTDRALTSALAAHEVRPGDIHGAEALIYAASAVRADPSVLVAKDALVSIADTPDGLSADARIALGDVLALVGENERAHALYDAALVAKPDDERALAGLAQHHAASGNKIAALALRRQIALAVPDEAERLAGLLEVGAAFAEQGSDESAAEVYEEARALAPRDLPILHKLLALYQKLEAWPKLFDVLKVIAEVDVDPHRRAKTLFTMAQIAHTELSNRGVALELFEQTLDVEPSLLEAFALIAKMLTESKDWVGLEQMYKRMIGRAINADDRVLQRALYEQIGLLYRDRLKDHPQAIQAFQIAAQLDPTHEKVQTMLRELLAKTGQTSGAVAVTLERVLREPMDVGPYPALFDLLASQPGARDRALCVSSAMRFLGVNHPAAIGLRTSFPQPPIEAIVMNLGALGWRELLHPELDPYLCEIFEVIAPAVVDVAISRLPIRERLAHPGPALKGHDWLAKIVGRAAAIFGAPAPRLYTRRLPGPAISAAPTRPASILVYPQALGGISREVLAFLIGKHVVELVPPLLARALCPSTTELKALASSAARIATGQTEPGDVALRDRLKREDVARVGAAVNAAMAKSGKLDVLRWSQLASLSTSRAGLLLAGDLEAARAAIAIEPQAPGDLNPREKMRELMTWYMGDAVASLRRRLGVALT